MQFIDKVKISVTAGKGGNGVVRFRREKYVPPGDPRVAMAGTAVT